MIIDIDVIMLYVDLFLDTQEKLNDPLEKITWFCYAVDRTKGLAHTSQELLLQATSSPHTLVLIKFLVYSKLNTFSLFLIALFPQGVPCLFKQDAITGVSYSSVKF